MNLFTPIIIFPGARAGPKSWEKAVSFLDPRTPVMVLEHRDLDNVDAMVERARACHYPKFSAVGHSMGGYALSELLRSDPDRIVEAVFANTRVTAPTESEIQFRMQEIEAGPQAYKAGLFTDAYFGRGFTAGNARDPAFREMVRESETESTDFDVAVRHHIACMNRKDAHDVLRGLRPEVRVTLVSGANDQILPLHYQLDMYRHLASAQMITLPLCGHSPQLEHPARMGRLLRGLANKKYEIDPAPGEAEARYALLQQRQQQLQGCDL
jgi:pimeloyl-ACP methyl ester carboxylesterase